MRRRFAQVDVFTDVAYRGNPVAVVIDADGLSSDEMQQVASWTNLSETTFVLPPTTSAADYRVRIFTLSRELPFAGHPTLGTCHAWRSAGGRPRGGDVILQECPAGLVTIRASGGRLAFSAPPLVRSGPVEETFVARIASVLRIDRGDIVDAEWVDNGPGWVAVLLADAAAVLAVRPTAIDFDLGVVGLYPPGAPQAIEVRAFFPRDGAAVEDPVTGSLQASLAPWLLRTGRVTAPYVAGQGAAIGRAGLAHVSCDDDGTIWVGGGTVTCIGGHITV